MTASTSVTVLGYELLTYLTASDTDELIARVVNGQELRPEAEQVFLTIQQHVDNAVSKSPLDWFSVHYDISTMLASYRADQQCSLGNYLRQRAGGVVPTIAHPDPVKHLLISIVSDYYPSLLLPIRRSDPVRRGTLPVTTTSHPAHKDFCRAVLADDTLSLLFPGAPEDTMALAPFSTQFSSVLLTSHQSGTIHIGSLTESLISNAHFSAACDGPVTFETVSVACEAFIDHLRRFAKGETVEARTLVLLSGRLPTGHRVSTSSGALFSTPEVIREYLPIDTDRTFIYETTRPIRLLECRPAMSEGHHDIDDELDAKVKTEVSKDYGRFRHRVETLRLALLLAGDASGPPATQELAFLTLDPLDPTPTYAYSIDAYAVRRNVLDVTSISRLTYWEELLRRTPSDSLEVGQYRLLTATERNNPTDGLVDAIICWENMFGTNQETTFRVTLAMSLLLADSSKERREVQAELRSLYTQRSKLVHGLEGYSTVIEAKRYRAVEFAILALRVLYRDAPWLIDLNESAERAAVVALMGGISHR